MCPSLNQDFARAVPDERGCGDREEGGVYLEVGFSKHGMPFDWFLYCPPQPIPPGMDIINKPICLERRKADGTLFISELTGESIFDVFIWIGESHYPTVPDYIEEGKRLGLSRRVSESIPLDQLTKESRMVLAHPKARVIPWRMLLLPDVCGKHAERHDVYWFSKHAPDHIEIRDEWNGPCLWKLWDLLPIPADQDGFPNGDGTRSYMRTIGSTTYSFTPTGEGVLGDSYQPGFFGAFPISGVALIKRDDGTVNAKAEDRLKGAEQARPDISLPWYDADK